MIDYTNVIWILLSSILILVHTQTPPTENIVINQSSDALLSCPITDCANVQWNSVTVDDSVTIIGTAGNILSQYQKYYAINTTAGYCTLIVLHATVDTTAGHINCVDFMRTGLTSKSFNVYVISDGPRCIPPDIGPDGYVTDRQTLTYQCLMTYGGGGTSGYVEMTWLNAQGVQPAGALRSTAQNQVSSRFDVVAVKPSVSQYTCRSSFGNKNISSATIITKDCVVNPISVKYAVSYVKLSREGENFVPGTNITCMADGVPPPSYRWIDSTTGATYMTGPNLQVNKASTDLYHCEASNTLNSAPLKSGSIMFNSSVNPDEIVKAQATPGWVIPVVICVPLMIILLILIVCMVWPVCPISRAIRNRRAARLMKDEGRSDNVDTSVRATNLDSSLNSVENHPDIVPKPRAKPRSTVSSPKSSLDRPTQPPPAPKKPAGSKLSGAGAANESSELLYADIGPAPQATTRLRPPRPQPSRQNEAIYTPVMRS